MPCDEFNRLAGICESKRQAYTYIRLNEGKVHVSKDRYDELVKEAYAGLTGAIKDLGWHRMKCTICQKEPEKNAKA
jgi:hypothetical protein